MKRDVKALDTGQLDLMWNFLKFGNGKPNISLLRENLDNLRQLMIQKTGGQEKYAHSADVDMDDLSTICCCICIETMQLYLSGGLDLIEEFLKPREVLEISGKINPELLEVNT